MKKSNCLTHAEREFDVLEKTDKDAVVLEFKKPILFLVDKFGKSGQSGGCAPFVSALIADTVNKLCMFQPITGITGIKSEWGDTGSKMFQNNRCSAVFKHGVKGKPYYLDAIVWRGEKKYDTFTGTVCGISSRQSIKKFPFIPKTFYVDVVRVHNKKKHKVADAVSCGDGDYVYCIKDRKQLAEVFKYYDKYKQDTKIY